MEVVRGVGADGDEAIDTLLSLQARCRTCAAEIVESAGRIEHVAVVGVVGARAEVRRVVHAVGGVEVHLDGGIRARDDAGVDVLAIGGGDGLHAPVNVEGRGKHIVRKFSLAGHRHRRDARIGIVGVGDVEVRTHDVAADRPCLRVDDIRDRELGTAAADKAADLIRNRQSRDVPLRHYFERNVVEKERPVGGREGLEFERMLAGRQHDILDRPVVDFAGRCREIFIEDPVAVNRHLVGNTGVAAALLAFPRKLGAIRAVVGENLRRYVPHL